MTHATTRRRFITLAALRQLPSGLVLPVLVLLPVARDVSPAQIGILFGAYSATTVLFELPTGGFADVVGARPVLLTATALAVAATIIVSTAHTFPAMLAGYTIFGVSRALDSGPLQSWYVNHERAHDPHAPVRVGLSRASAAASVAIALGALITAAITHVGGAGGASGPVIAIAIPPLVAATMFGLYGILVALWLVPVRRGPRPRFREVLADVPRTLTSGFGLARSRGPLRRLLFYTAAIGAALAGIELLTPLHLSRLSTDTNATATVFALLACAAFLVAGAGAWASPFLARRFGSAPVTLIATTIVAAVALAGVGLPGTVTAGGMYLIFYAALGAGEPLLDELTHDAVTSQHRTTMLSIRSMAFQAVGMLTSVSAGWLADRAGTPPAFIAVATVMSCGALAFVGWKRLGDAPSTATEQEATANYASSGSSSAT